ncbi:MAG TPA: aldo/keto reductase [Chitinophagaceae bacterium]
MEYRKFGNTDLRVSVAGFGAWAIGGNARVGNTPIGWGPADDKTSLKAIHAALDEGINFFDTADFYGLGHSEELIGAAIGRQKDIMIATKVGQKMEGESIVADYSMNHILQACEKSLLRLRRDVIDYYQLHNARVEHLEQGECLKAMAELQKQGKIRYWGISLNTFNPMPEAKWMMDHNAGDGFQLVLNIINQRAVPVIEEAVKQGYGIIARMPLQFGLLTGKFDQRSRFSADDHRSFRLTPALLERAMELLHTHLDPLSREFRLGWNELALGFAASVHGVSTVIPGIRTADHARHNARALRKLPAEAVHRLRALAAEMEELVALMQQLR